MIRIPVEASRSYEVLLGRGLLDRVGEEVRRATKAESVVLVAGENVFPLHGARVRRSLEEAGLRVLCFPLKPGEGSKTLETYGRLLYFLHENRLTRSDALIALGGGVTGDLTGFAAATYQRGIDFVQIPTTLLAMVDSSVGGKTAVDLPGGKNQVGAFWQPAVVLCDPDTLRTLPEEEYRCGSAEVLKYGVLGNAAFFRELLRTPIREQEEHVIETCVAMKRDIVRGDEYDRGQRQLLNLGHSFGHAVEACSGFTVLHGQAVAAGMAIIARAAAEKGFCAPETRDAILSGLRRYGLPGGTDYALEDLAAAVCADKKRSGDTMRLVVPREIGRCEIVKVPLPEIPDWLRAGGVR